MLDLEDLQAEEKSKLTSLTREYESLLAEVTRTQEAAEQAEQQVVSMEEKRQGTLKALDDLKVNLCEVCAPACSAYCFIGICVIVPGGSAVAHLPSEMSLNAL